MVASHRTNATGGGARPELQPQTEAPTRGMGPGTLTGAHVAPGV